MTAPASTLRQPRPGTKQATLVALLSRVEGATIKDLVERTGWQSNTVHAALTTLRKSGWQIAVDQTGPVRRYFV